MTRIRAVFFDLGYTLADETRLWTLWAKWLGVDPADFFAELDALIARRAHHREVFARFAPSLDLDRAKRERADQGWPPDLLSYEDLYPDAAPCLRSLKAAGYRIGVAGNQPQAVEAAVAATYLPIDVIASSERWGVSKPDPAFFARIAESAGIPANEIAYVGDRIDNDVLPALAAGMTAVFVPRGPWGTAHATWPEASRATITISDLRELPGRLAALGPVGSSLLP